MNAITPGRAAYEAMAAHALSDDGPPGASVGWDALEPWQRARWEAAARAAIRTAPSAIIKVSNAKLSAEEVQRLREQFREAVSGEIRLLP